MNTILVSLLLVAAVQAKVDPQVVVAAGLAPLAHHGYVLPSAAAVHRSTVVKSVVEQPAEVATEVTHHAIPVAAPLHYGYGLHHAGLGYGLGLHHGLAGHVIAKREAEPEADADAYYGYGLGYGYAHHGYGYAHHGLGYGAHGYGLHGYGYGYPYAYGR